MTTLLDLKAGDEFTLGGAGPYKVTKVAGNRVHYHVDGVERSIVRSGARAVVLVAKPAPAPAPAPKEKAPEVETVSEPAEEEAHQSVEKSSKKTSKKSSKKYSSD